jgi:predicted ATP-binding protein involved in virulence
MRIRQLDILNFKGFYQKSFYFNPQFTVIIGNNATGKTSILDALTIIMSAYVYGIDGLESYHLRNIEKDEIRVKTFENDPKPQLPVSISASGEIAGQSFTGTRERQKMNSTAKASYKGAFDITDMATRSLIESRIGEPVIFPLLAYHGTGRLWAEHKEKVKYKQQREGVLMGYANCLSPKSSSKDFLSWYKTYEDEIRKFDNEKDRLLLRVFNETIASLVPQWEDMAYSFKDEQLMGFYTNANGNKEKLCYSQLSDGFRNMIGIAADLVYRCIKLNPHLGENVVKATEGLVLIDELDLHLHPIWQKKIVADLKRIFPKVQFVATTHSPFIVQSLKADEIINLDELPLAADPDMRSIEETVFYMGDTQASKSMLNEGLSDVYKKIILKETNTADSGHTDFEEAAGKMGIGSTKSNAFDHKLSSAEHFYKTLEKALAVRNTSPETFSALKKDLDNILIKNSDDPAFVAQLKIKKLSKLGE